MRKTKTPKQTICMGGMCDTITYKIRNKTVIEK